jgi:lipopolysaccharide/colanic/teichoic acid biosynthesis glycosyltransferase
MSFYQKFGKRSIDIIFSLLAFLLLWPFLLLVALLIKIDSSGPIFFKQKRTGKKGVCFTMYKFRTMVDNAEKLKEKYRRLNEADGPVFKINNDPRFTKIGKTLSHTGFDEFPQFFNVLKGEISLVGPRPLPIKEEAGIELQYQKKRRLVKPGIISSWLIKGAHKLSFKEWMDSDLEDIQKMGFTYDMRIILKTFLLVLKYTRKEIKKSK